MGIRTDPGYRLYTGNSFCFPIGKTPRKLYASVSGIKTGKAWIPGDSAPQNGVWLLESTNGTHWYNFGPPYMVQFILLGNISAFFMGSGDFPRMLYFYQETPCLFSGSDVIHSEFSEFYGGSFVVTSRD